MAEENQVELQQITKKNTTSYKRSTTSNKRTATSNYKKPKESRSW